MLVRGVNIGLICWAGLYTCKNNTRWVRIVNLRARKSPQLTQTGQQPTQTGPQAHIKKKLTLVYINHSCSGVLH